MLAIGRQTQTSVHNSAAASKISSRFKERHDVKFADTRSGLVKSCLFGEEQSGENIACPTSHADNVGLDRLRAELIQDRGDRAKALNDLDRLIAVAQLRRNERAWIRKLVGKQRDPSGLIERSVVCTYTSSSEHLSQRCRVAYAMLANIEHCRMQAKNLDLTNQIVQGTVGDRAPCMLAQTALHNAQIGQQFGAPVIECLRVVQCARTPPV